MTAVRRRELQFKNPIVWGITRVLGGEFRGKGERVYGYKGNTEAYFYCSSRNL